MAQKSDLTVWLLSHCPLVVQEFERVPAGWHFRLLRSHWTLRSPWRARSQSASSFVVDADLPRPSIEA